MSRQSIYNMIRIGINGLNTDKMGANGKLEVQDRIRPPNPRQMTISFKIRRRWHRSAVRTLPLSLLPFLLLPTLLPICLYILNLPIILPTTHAFVYMVHNLHDPYSCSRTENANPKWIEVREMLDNFLLANLTSNSVDNMKGPRWTLSECDCTCPDLTSKSNCVEHTQQCPTGSLVMKVLGYFTVTEAFRHKQIYGWHEEEFGTNFLYLIRSMFGISNVMHSGWKVFGIMARVSQQLRERDQNFQEQFIRQRFYGAYDTEVKSRMEGPDAEKYRGIPYNGVFKVQKVDSEFVRGSQIDPKEIKFFCFPDEFGVDDAIHAVKYNFCRLGYHNSHLTQNNVMGDGVLGSASKLTHGDITTNSGIITEVLQQIGRSGDTDSVAGASSKSQASKSESSKPQSSLAYRMLRAIQKLDPPDTEVPLEKIIMEVMNFDAEAVATEYLTRSFRHSYSKGCSLTVAAGIAEVLAENVLGDPEKNAWNKMIDAEREKELNHAGLWDPREGRRPKTAVIESDSDSAGSVVKPSTLGTPKHRRAYSNGDQAYAHSDWRRWSHDPNAEVEGEFTLGADGKTAVLLDVKRKEGVDETDPGKKSGKEVVSKNTQNQQRNKPTRRFLASRDVKKMRRLHNFLSAWLREIEFQLQTWASFYPENKYFSTLIGMREGRRLTMALDKIEQNLTKEFFCSRLKDSAVGFQGEWMTESMFMNPVGESVGLQKHYQADVRTRCEIPKKYLDELNRQTRVRGKKETEFWERRSRRGRTRKNHNDNAKTDRKESSSESSPDNTSPSVPLLEPISEQYAFVGVMFDNKNSWLYVEAIRTMARALFRVHLPKQYRFVIMTPEGFSKETEASLTREPSYNIEVLRVPDDELVDGANFGERESESSTNSNATGPSKRKVNIWWSDRGTKPTTLQFYRWNLVQFEKIIFIDADMLVLDRIDQLFQVDHEIAVGITPFSYINIKGVGFPYINVGSMVLKPDRLMYRKIMLTLKLGDLDSDPIRAFFEKGLDQPWLDHFLMRHSTRAGLARFVEGAVVDGGVKMINSSTSSDGSLTSEEASNLPDSPEGVAEKEHLEAIRRDILLGDETRNSDSESKMSSEEKEKIQRKKGEQVEEKQAENRKQQAQNKASLLQLSKNYLQNPRQLEYIGCGFAGGLNFMHPDESAFPPLLPAGYGDQGRTQEGWIRTGDGRHRLARMPWFHGEGGGAGSEMADEVNQNSVDPFIGIGAGKNDEKSDDGTTQNTVIVTPSNLKEESPLHAFTRLGRYYGSIDPHAGRRSTFTRTEDDQGRAADQAELDNLRSLWDFYDNYHCVLPMEYNFFVDYKSTIQLMDIATNEFGKDSGSSEKKGSQKNIEWIAKWEEGKSTDATHAAVTVDASGEVENLEMDDAAQERQQAAEKTEKTGTEKPDSTTDPNRVANDVKGVPDFWFASAASKANKPDPIMLKHGTEGVNYEGKIKSNIRNALKKWQVNSHKFYYNKGGSGRGGSDGSGAGSSNSSGKMKMETVEDVIEKAHQAKSEQEAEDIAMQTLTQRADQKIDGEARQGNEKDGNGNDANSNSKDVEVDPDDIEAPRILHWAGENRNPWERVHPLSRSKTDQLWWDEYEWMTRDSGTRMILAEC